MTAREKHEQSANETSVCAHNAVGAAGSGCSLLRRRVYTLQTGEQWPPLPSKKGGQPVTNVDGDGAHGSTDRLPCSGGMPTTTLAVIETYERAVRIPTGYDATRARKTPPPIRIRGNTTRGVPTWATLPVSLFVCELYYAMPLLRATTAATAPTRCPSCILVA